MTISSKTGTSTAQPLRDDGALRGAVMLALFILLGLGLSYSLVATGITGALFPEQAHGSLLRDDARVVGSALVAQPFANARYFQPAPRRPSTTRPRRPAATRRVPIPTCKPASPPRAPRWLHATASHRRRSPPS